MHSDIAKRDNVRLFDFGVTIRKLIRQSSGGLADDDQLLQHSALPQFIIHEFFGTNSLKESSDSIRSVYDIGISTADLTIISPHNAHKRTTPPSSILLPQSLPDSKRRYVVSSDVTLPMLPALEQLYTALLRLCFQGNRIKMDIALMLAAPPSLLDPQPAPLPNTHHLRLLRTIRRQRDAPGIYLAAAERVVP